MINSHRSVCTKHEIITGVKSVSPHPYRWCTQERQSTQGPPSHSKARAPRFESWVSGSFTELTTLEVDVPNSLPDLTWRPIFEWYVDLQTGTKKAYVFKRNWLRPRFDILPIFTSWIFNMIGVTYTSTHRTRTKKAHVLKRNWLRPQFNMLPNFLPAEFSTWSGLPILSTHRTRTSSLWWWTRYSSYELQKLRDKLMGTGTIGVGNHLALLVCFVSSEKWVQIESIHLRQICRTPPWFDFSPQTWFSGHFTLYTWPIDEFTIV